MEIELDQRLEWLVEGPWEWRFPTVVAPRYGAGAGDAERPGLGIVTGDTGARARLELG